jgi:hypothetical protein
MHTTPQRMKFYKAVLVFPFPNNSYSFEERGIFFPSGTDYWSQVDVMMTKFQPNFLIE